MKRILSILLLLTMVSTVMLAAKKKTSKTQTDREYWVEVAYKLAQPVLENMARGELQKNMQVEVSPTWDGRNKKVTYMECFGRLMAGLSPWLTLPDDDTPEGQKRRQLREWALQSYKNAVDPSSPDYLLWRQEGQTLVDAAYVAESLIRGYDALWVPLDSLTKQRYIQEFSLLRRVEPPYTNWLLFSSTVESFLAKVGTSYDAYRVNMGVRKTEEWYVGDGWYSDGQGTFAFDYYTSYVFHAMYLETLQNMADAKGYGWGINYKQYYQRALRRAQKHAVILERFISPEGTFPVFGRSIPYRMAALQPLALMAWYQTLPEELSNGQVRRALTKVMHRMYDNQDNFNEGGFLTIGFCGSQPNVADWYTNNGSLYMTSLSLMPLGLPATHPFWTDAEQPTTQEKAWGGQPFTKDHFWRDEVPEMQRPQAILQLIDKVNTSWQSRHPAEVRAFWDEAAYHTGNMEAYKLTRKEHYRAYSERWAKHNHWKGATGADPAKWKYKQYGEGQDYVLFGDWQICFQTYLDLNQLSPDDRKTARAKEVMGYIADSKATDYWWWADALYMVMPVMTKMYQLTGDTKYLDKLYQNLCYTDSIMLDPETGLYFRDGKYVYPKHKTASGQKDFWARGDGWVLAGLAKVLQDMPTTYVHQPFFKEKFIRLAHAVVQLQQHEGYWTRSMMDAEQAPGPETSGTAFFCYGLLWGVNHGYLPRQTFAPAIAKAWNYLTRKALQPDGRVGYVQPIGERAIPGQTVDANSESNFGVGAFLLAACEYYRYINS
ncbi:MAG: DUF2264 domain-containing protein [Prevotella sp.]|nr:DUF2264 domain-containing protein [Prevotella sp.]